MRSRRTQKSSLTAGLAPRILAGKSISRARSQNKLRETSSWDKNRSKGGEKHMLRRWRKQRKKQRRTSRRWLVSRRKRCSFFKVSSSKPWSHKSANRDITKWWTREDQPIDFSKARSSGTRLTHALRSFSNWLLRTTILLGQLRCKQRWSILILIKPGNKLKVNSVQSGQDR